MAIRQIKEGFDYILPDGMTSVWITVNNVSIYIKRNDEGVSVNLYPLDDEDSDSLASAWLTFAEAVSNPFCKLHQVHHGDEANRVLGKCG